MRILVAGATGVIGRRVVPRLVAAGHDVTAMTRRRERADALKATGATALVCDVYDRERLIEASSKARIEAVVHLLTDLPKKFKPRLRTSSTNQLRREGTRNLIEAAQAAHARRFVAESIAFLYEPDGTPAKREDARPYADAPRSLRRAIEAVIELERQVTEELQLGGVVLRFGWLYGPGTWFAPDGSITRDIRRRMYPVVGEGTGIWSFVHVDDAAASVVAAVEGGRAGIYNIVDDCPLPIHTWVPRLAHAIGAPKPLRVPTRVARLLAGRAATEMANRGAGASNQKAKSQLGWTPRYPTFDASTARLEPSDAAAAASS